MGWGRVSTISFFLKETRSKQEKNVNMLNVGNTNASFLKYLIHVLIRYRKIQWQQGDFEARDWTCILSDTSWMCFCCAMTSPTIPGIGRPAAEPQRGQTTFSRSHSKLGQSQGGAPNTIEKEVLTCTSPPNFEKVEGCFYLWHCNWEWGGTRDLHDATRLCWCGRAWHGVRECQAPPLTPLLLAVWPRVLVSYFKGLSRPLPSPLGSEEESQRNEIPSRGKLILLLLSPWNGYSFQTPQGMGSLGTFGEWSSDCFRQQDLVCS